MIQDIIVAINDSIKTCLAVENSIYYGLTGFIDDNDKHFPFIVDKGKIIKICPDDKVDLKIYHKIDRSEFNFRENPDYSFGRNITYEVEARAKMVVILKSAINLSNPIYNPLSFQRILPQRVTVEDYSLVTLSKGMVSTDHDSIVNREWKDISYSKHKCKFLVFEVNYNIRALTCKLDCASFLLLEDTYKILIENGSAILL